MLFSFFNLLQLLFVESNSVKIFFSLEIPQISSCFILAQHLWIRGTQQFCHNCGNVFRHVTEYALGLSEKSLTLIKLFLSGFKLFFRFVDCLPTFIKFSTRVFQLFALVLKFLASVFQLLSPVSKFFLSIMEFLPAFSDFVIDIIPKPFTAEGYLFFGNSMNRFLYRADRTPVSITVAVFRGTFDSNTDFHKSAVKTLFVKAILTYKDIRCYRDHIGDMLRSLKNTRDHIVFLQKRINVRNQFAFESDLLTYGEPASIHKLFLHSTLGYCFRESAFQKLRLGEIFRQTGHRDICVAASRPQFCVDLPDTFCFCH